MTHKWYCRILTRLGWPVVWRRPRKGERFDVPTKVCRMCAVTADIKPRKVEVKL